MTERKPHGHGVQDIRLGGLAVRMRTVRKTVGAYLCGKLSRIAELEETILPCCTHERYSWMREVSTNVVGLEI